MVEKEVGVLWPHCLVGAYIPLEVFTMFIPWTTQPTKMNFQPLPPCSICKSLALKTARFDCKALTFLRALCLRVQVCVCSCFFALQPSGPSTQPPHLMGLLMFKHAFDFIHQSECGHTPTPASNKFAVLWIPSKYLNPGVVMNGNKANGNYLQRPQI